MSAREGYTLVSPLGEGDVTVRLRLHAALTAQVRAETPNLVVDLAGLAYIDASCVQVLSRRPCEPGRGIVHICPWLGRCRSGIG